MLACIYTIAELQFDVTPPGTQLATDLSEILAAATRGRALTAKMTELRKDAAKPSGAATHDAIAAIEHAAAVVRRLSPRDVSIVVEVTAPDGPVGADRVQLEQIVQNLLLNARDACSGRGIVRITAMPALRGSGFMIEVTDDGVGMTPEVRKRIFDPFFTTKEFGRGTGLGLATVHALIEQLSGEISVTSAPGKGSTFRLYLPLARTTSIPPDGPVREKRAPRQSLPTGLRVLVVDDEDPVREAVRRILERRGYIVQTAPGARAALAVIDGGAIFDVILSDIMMPEMSGHELGAVIHRRDPTMPIVYMTGYDDLGDGAHNERVLAKPFTADALVKHVRRSLVGTESTARFRAVGGMAAVP